MRSISTGPAALALLLFSSGACAQAAKPMVAALLAAVGDRIEIVRQVEGVGSNIEPYTRRSLQVNGPTLNFAVLRGLDRAIEEEEPQTQRVLLQWSMPASVAKGMADASGADPEALILAALTQHLQSLPERAQWDRIEVIVPGYSFSERGGIGRKLSGIGIYVQPLANVAMDFSESGDMTLFTGNEREGNYRTIHPVTGETTKSSVYVAPYMYFQRLTLDARSLEIVARKRHFDNVKYADPSSTALDVMNQMPLATLMGKLLETVERSAYQSVRGVKSEVKVTAPIALPAASAPR